MPAPIEALFPEVANLTDDDLSRMGSDLPTLMIAMTARTGSSHLCSGLSYALPIGRPTELLNARDNLVWEKTRRGVSTFAELLSQFFAESKEYIVFKTSWGDFQYFDSRIFRLFPNLKILYLNRLDTEAQAVSLFRAVVTGKWHDSKLIANNSTHTPEQIAAEFNLVKICRTIRNLEKEKEAWENFFFSHELQPPRINYESFKDNLASAVKQIARHMGFGTVDVSGIQSDFKPLSDDINDEWIRKVRNYRNGFPLDSTPAR